MVWYGSDIWLPAVCTGIHGFLAKSTGKTGKILEKNCFFSDFVGFFSGPDFAKISAPTFPIVLESSSATETRI